MGTKITKGNVKSAIKDDKAHIDYLKRDVLDDQKGGGKYKDINQTADEKHISKLAGDIKHDHSFLSKHWTHSSPLNNIDMVGSAGSFDSSMHDPVQHKEFDAQAFDTNREALRNESLKSDEEEKEEEKVINPGDSPESMAAKITPLNSVEIAEGEVDGIAYGAADVDGQIAVDTSTVGYDDTMNLP